MLSIDSGFLTQHLRRAYPELLNRKSEQLPQLDPPFYGLPALALAQRWGCGWEPAAALPELVTDSVGPRLTALLIYLCPPYSLAEQGGQAWRWDLTSSPPLPPGLPGGGPAPGSPEVARYLIQLRQRFP